MQQSKFILSATSLCAFFGEGKHCLIKFVISDSDTDKLNENVLHEAGLPCACYSIGVQKDAYHVVARGTTSLFS